MPIDRDIYSICAVRLVNFHNINHVTIPVQNGGHLFLLGDNGSGKTTVLDAIHYILSAGEQIELNSAARMGGNKQDGRRINGVVTRVNVETGALCPEGRVTYAALELRNGTGNSVCVGVGLSIAGVNAPLQQWGFRLDEPVGDLPLLCTGGDGGEYPPNREEFKKIVQKRNGHYYKSMSTFAQMLARDFFPNPSQYDEYRKFLNMCKAYREIAAKAGNYHELFKSLLPEPESEILQELRLRLKNLRESSSALTALEKKCDYLRALYEEKRKIDNFRSEIRILELGVLFFESGRQRRILLDAEEKSRAMALDLEQKRLCAEQSEKHEQELLRALTDLKSRDVGSLIETEKSRTRELAVLGNSLECLHQKEMALQGRLTVEKQKHHTLLTQNAETLNTIAGKLAETLSVWTQLPLKAALDAIQQAQLADLPYRNLDGRPLRELDSAFGGAVERGRALSEAAAERLGKAQKEYQEADETLAALEKQPEAIPEALADYTDFLDDLDRRMLMACPLYLKLHWKDSVPAPLRSALEELIGEETLATIVADPDAAGEIRERMLDEDRYGFRLAELYPENDVPPSSRICEFLEQFFDSGKDAPYLSVLARELDGCSIPVFEAANPVRFVDWRGSFRVFYGTGAKLIGEEERKTEQKRRIADAREIRKYKEDLLKQARQHQSECEKRLKSLLRFEERCHELFMRLNEQRTALSELDRQLEKITAETAENTAAIQNANRSRMELTQLVETLRRQIREQNLEKLDAEVSELTRRFDAAQKQREHDHDEWTSQKTRFDDQTERLNECGKNAASAAERLAQAFSISPECRSEEALKKYLAERHIDNHGGCSDKIAVQKQNMAASGGAIRTLIHASEGIHYSFTYDDIANELFSREHRTLGDILNRLQTDLDQQREILTEETRRNFERILLEEFRESLRKRIFALERMNELINRRLAGHFFGRNTYSLKIVPFPEYAPLVRVMKSFSDQIPESAAELKEIFSSHANEILETPANRVPEILDYRNYFRYEMLLHTEGTDGRVMDTRTKSVGSGGEQAVPNYLLVMMIAHLLFDKTEGTNSRIRINTILFDEAFYGIDQQRQNQLLSFAEELGLQLMIASPNQDGIKPELANSTNVFVRKDKEYQAHLFCFNWKRDKDLLPGANEIPQGTELT
ncbi:SbcC/MukB-like Walker B domain-containing protein [Victivallis vadensis]|uniref:SbcC/MukB-like Walker B domain-containing protein n=1 Tax=Victivallis vadensis TaxID=172901 RepID=UPI00307DA01D